jgi:hypothetical protein
MIALVAGWNTMPSFRVSVPHELGREIARQRVEGFLDQVQRDMPTFVSDVGGDWQDSRLDFRLKASGMSITGMLVVEDTAAEVSGSLPLAAALFRGQIERTIRDELSRLLS